MIYVITGQTATGKTKRALELANKKNGEIVNCDSRQIYKQLNIITGKDLSFTNRIFTSWKKTGEYDVGYYSFQNEGRLWLYDILSPHMPFSAFEYRTLAVSVIHDIEMRGKTPIIVGGTYFYLQHLLYDLLDTPVEPNPQLRNKLANESTPNLQHMLFSHAPEVFMNLNNSEKNNRHRLIRKIEVVLAGKTVPSHRPQEYDFAPPFTEKTTTFEGYHFTDRQRLNDIIKNRVHTRLHEGALDEARDLLHSGYTGDEPGLQTIGYVQVIQFLKNRISEKEMLEEWISKEKQYAKRQYTFAKRDPHISWIEV